MTPDEVRGWMLATGVVIDAQYFEDDGSFTIYWNNQFWSLRMGTAKRLITCPLEELPRSIAVAGEHAALWIALASWRLEHE